MYGGDVSGVVRSLTILFVFAGGCTSQQTETEEVELATMVAARWEVDASVDESTSVYTGRSTSSDSRDTSVFIPDLLSSQPTSCDDSSETEMMAADDDDGAAGSLSDHSPEEADDGAAAADDENATGDDAAAPTDAASPDAQGAVGGEDWDAEVRAQPKHTLQGRLLRKPKLQEMGVRMLLIPQLRESREREHFKEIALETERATAAYAENYTGGLESNAQYYYEMVQSELQSYVSTGEEPPERLSKWLEDMRTNKIHRPGSQLEGTTNRDIIANLQVKLDMKDDESESLREEVMRLRRLLHTTTTELYQTREARDMSYEMRRREADRREEDLGDDPH